MNTLNTIIEEENTPDTQVEIEQNVETGEVITANGVKLTPDTEWEKEKLAEQLHEWYLEATYQEDAKYNIDAVVPYNDLPEGSKILDRYIAGKIIEMFTSRDTYWKERVGEAVKAERDRIAEAAIEIAIKRVQDVLCNYADDNIEDEKLNRIWFKAVVKKALTPITNEDNLK